MYILRSVLEYIENLRRRIFNNSYLASLRGDVHILGILYNLDKLEDLDKFKRKLNSIILFTYRHGYSFKLPRVHNRSNKIVKFLHISQISRHEMVTINTDKNWGCVVRATQMALIQTLITLVFGFNFDVDVLIRESRENSTDSTEDSSAINENCDQIIEFKRVLNKDGIEEREKYKTLCILMTQFCDTYNALFSIYNFILTDLIIKTCTKFLKFGPTSAAICVDKIINDARLPVTSIAFPDSVFYISKIYNSFNKNKNLIAWLSLNKQLDLDEEKAVKSLFALKQFSGIVGGSRYSNKAYYICGCDSNNLYYIDPHIACSPAFTCIKGIDIAKDFTSDRICFMRWQNINTSMTMVFLFKGLQDFEDFLQNTLRNTELTESYPFEFVL